MATSCKTNRVHLDAFLEHRKAHPMCQGPVGWNVANWASQVGALKEGVDRVYPDSSRKPQLPSTQMSRNCLRVFVDDRGNSDVECFIAVMAWGGMRFDHGRAALAAHGQWLPIVKDLRANKLTPTEAFTRFSKTPTPGMGVAFFTKLICFIPTEPSARVLILDKWVSFSINLISQSTVVQQTRTGYVTPLNNSKNYGLAMEMVDHLVSLISDQGEKTDRFRIEEELFSRGKPKKLPWRIYVDPASSPPQHCGPRTATQAKR